MTTVLTVGELLDAFEGVDRKLPLASRGHAGAFWVNGVDIGTITLVTLGSGKGKSTVEYPLHEIWATYNGKKSEPFKAVAID